MNKQQAFENLVKAIEIGQSKGCYSLADVSTILSSIDFINKGIVAENTPATPVTTND